MKYDNLEILMVHGRIEEKKQRDRSNKFEGRGLISIHTYDVTTLQTWRYNKEENNGQWKLFKIINEPKKFQSPNHLI